MVHVPTKCLPPHLAAALSAVGYARPDIRVLSARTVETGSTGQSGRRSFGVLVSLASGARTGHYGSWGGPSLHGRGLIDGGGVVTLASDEAYIAGSSGYGPTYAVVHVHPDVYGELCAGGVSADVDELTDAEHHAIYCFAAIKGGQYRRDELRRRRVPDSTVDALVERGYLKRARNGATSITTKGKNARRIQH